MIGANKLVETNRDGALVYGLVLSGLVLTSGGPTVFTVRWEDGSVTNVAHQGDPSVRLAVDLASAAVAMSQSALSPSADETREAIQTIKEAVDGLRPHHLGDPRLRATLHATRKALDRLLETAERIHHPCRS